MSGEKRSERPRRLRSTFIAGISITLAGSAVIWFLSQPTKTERRIAGTWKLYRSSDVDQSGNPWLVRFAADGRIWKLKDSVQAIAAESESRWSANDDVLRFYYRKSALPPWKYIQFVINEYWAGRDGLGSDEQYEIQWRTENEIELTGGINRAAVNPTTLIGIRHEVHPGLVSPSFPTSSADASSREKLE